MKKILNFFNPMKLKYKKRPPYHVTQIANWYIERCERDGDPSYIRGLLAFLYFVYAAELYDKKYNGGKKLFKCRFVSRYEMPIESYIVKTFQPSATYPMLFYKNYKYLDFSRNSDFIDLESQEKLESYFLFFKSRGFGYMKTLCSGVGSPNYLYTISGRNFKRIKDFDILVHYKSLLKFKRNVLTDDRNANNVIKINFNGVKK